MAYSPHIQQQKQPQKLKSLLQLPDLRNRNLGKHALPIDPAEAFGHGQCRQGQTFWFIGTKFFLS